MALLEHEAQRFAEALDDYEHVSVDDIGGCDESGFWVVVHDHRFDHRYLIDSHVDYWDFVSAYVRCLRPANLAAETRNQVAS